MRSGQLSRLNSIVLRNALLRHGWNRCIVFRHSLVGESGAIKAADTDAF